MKLIIPGTIIAVIISVIVYHLIRINHYSKIGERLAMNTVPFSIHPNQSTSKILMLGDSLAVGVGSSNPNYSIAGLISSDFPRADITNIAVSGARIHDGINQINPLSDNHFDAVIIQIGGNDVTHITSQKKISTDLKILLEKVHALSSNVIVYSSGSVGFAPIFKAPISWIYTLQTKRTYKTIQQTIVENDAIYIPLYVSWSEDIFKTNIDHYYAADRFHVTDAAYAIWYEKIKPLLIPILK